MSEKYIPFRKYRLDRCAVCIRVGICEKTDNAIILCAVCAYFKGEGDRNLLSGAEDKLIQEVE
jgi:hypothetical protein